MQTTTIPDERLAGHMTSPTGPAHHLVGEGTEQQASAAAVAHTRCIIRCGADGTWRAWQLRR